MFIFHTGVSESTHSVIFEFSVVQMDNVGANTIQEVLGG